jgi:hypothetical protein
MNKEKRQPYRDLINIIPVGYGLCNFCKFAEWDGGDCCSMDLTCTHPLPIINGYINEEHPYDVWQGADCWGFRPNITLQQLGIIVSITLDKKNAHWSKSQKEYIAIIPSENDKRENMVGVLI